MNPASRCCLICTRPACCTSRMMTMSNEYSLRFANWPQDMAPLREVRTRVFIEEQNVPPEEEWDGIDDQCIHVLAVDAEERPIGAGNQIGRASCRGRGE